MSWGRITTIVILLALRYSVVNAQFQEIGAGIGGALYTGDLSPEDFNSNLKIVRPAVGVFFVQHFNDRLAARASLIKMTITGDDKNINKPERNLSFQSNIIELALLGEFYLVKWDPFENNRFTLYGSTGITVYHHNPKAYYAGNWYELQPLRTEGQGTASYPDRKPYHRFQLSIPITGGMKFNINEKLNLFVEFGPRITFTDFLDDVSNTYANENELRNLKGDIAVALSFRGNEISPKPYPSGVSRGNPGIRDYYWNGLAGISLNFDNLFGFTQGKRVKCPNF